MPAAQDRRQPALPHACAAQTHRPALPHCVPHSVPRFTHGKQSHQTHAPPSYYTQNLHGKPLPAPQTNPDFRDTGRPSVTIQTPQNLKIEAKQRQPTRPAQIADPLCELQRGWCVVQAGPGTSVPLWHL